MQASREDTRLSHNILWREAVLVVANLHRPWKEQAGLNMRVPIALVVSLPI